MKNRLGLILGVLGLIICSLTAAPIWAQNIITTVAGGGTISSTALSAELGEPTSLAVDSAGNVYVTPVASHQVFKITPAGDLVRVAGNGLPETSGDGGPAASAGLVAPHGVAVDSQDNVFILSGYFVRRVDATTGIITTVAGNGSTVFSGDGGPATSAGLDPSFQGKVTLDAAGDIYIPDGNHQRVRRVDAATGIITTVAGNGIQGFSGDGGPATSASLDTPVAIAVDSSGNLFIADRGNNRIRRVDATTGIITTVAGGSTPASGIGDGGLATAASLSAPWDVAVNSIGNIFIADFLRIRRVDAATGIISTVAGNGKYGFDGDGAPATSARIVALGIALDPLGNLYLCGQNNRVRRVDTTQVITTIAGGGNGGDGGPATSAVLSTPTGVATNASGNLFIVEYANNRLRRVNTASGIISNVVGDGATGSTGDGGPASDARLTIPFSAATDSAGDVFIADSTSNRVRRVDAATGIITTVAGNGSGDYSGDGGPATDASLYNPRDMAVDESNNLYIADTLNNVIRRVDAGTGIISTVAGDGNAGFSGDGGPATSASLDFPTAVTVDSAGNLFVIDANNQRVRRVDATNGTITTVAGNGSTGYSGDGGPATSASFHFNPDYGGGVALDGVGNIFITDMWNNRVRRVNASTGIISTVAGTGSFDFSGDGGPATSADLAQPYSMTLDGLGNLFIADIGNNRVRKVTFTTSLTLSASSLTFSDQPAGTTSASQMITVSNTGGENLMFAGLTIGGTNSGDFSIDANDTTCLVRTPVTPGSSCTIAVTFAPTADGSRSGTLTLSDNTSGSPQTVTLAGTGTITTVSLSAPSLTFDLQVAGTKSTNQMVTVTNTGTSTDLVFSAVSVSSNFVIDAAQTTCSTSAAVAPGGSCQVAVAFAPATDGTLSGSLTLTDDASPATQTVALSGTATAVSVNLSSLAFSGTVVGSTSSAQSVTLANSSTGNVTISGITASGDFAETNTCGSSIAAGSNCTIDVTFKPTATGSLTGTLSINDSASDSPQTVALSGTGQDFSIGARTASSTISAGGTASYDLLLSPEGGFSGDVSLTCSDTASKSTCSLSPASVTLNGTGNSAVTLKVTTTAPSEMVPPVFSPWDLPPMVVFWIGLLVLLGLRALGRFMPAHTRIRPALLASLTVVLLAITFWTACGGGGSPVPIPGTPPGTYTLAVTGTSGSLSHSTTVLLTVQ